MRRFIHKKLKDKFSSKPKSNVMEARETLDKQIDNKVMDTKEKVQLANAVLNNDVLHAVPKVKKVRKDKGLIERTESSAIILTEDNKELLHD